MIEDKDHQLRKLKGSIEQNVQSLEHQFAVEEAKVMRVKF